MQDHKDSVLGFAGVCGGTRVVDQAADSSAARELQLGAGRQESREVGPTFP